MKLIVVCGFVGSGKSRLIRSLLSSMDNVGLISSQHYALGISAQYADGTRDTDARHADTDGRDADTDAPGTSSRHADTGARDTKQSPIVSQFAALADKEYVVVELGLHDGALVADIVRCAQVQWCKIVVCVDALDERESVAMARLADDVVLTKSDLHPTAQIRAKLARAGLCNVYDVQDYRADDMLRAPMDGGAACADGVDTAACARKISALSDMMGAGLMSMLVALPARLEWESFVAWLNTALYLHPSEILRLKGVVATHGELVRVDCVGSLMYPGDRGFDELDGEFCGLGDDFGGLDGDDIVRDGADTDNSARNGADDCDGAGGFSGFDSHCSDAGGADDADSAACDRAKSLRFFDSSAFACDDAGSKPRTRLLMVYDESFDSTARHLVDTLARLASATPTIISLPHPKQTKHNL